MPVEDHAIHEKVRISSTWRYGCHNKPRPVQGQQVKSIFSGDEWPYVFSTECRGGRASDWACEGCEHIGPGDDYIERVTRNGK